MTACLLSSMGYAVMIRHRRRRIARKESLRGPRKHIQYCYRLLVVLAYPTHRVLLLNVSPMLDPGSLLLLRYIVQSFSTFDSLDIQIGHVRFAMSKTHADLEFVV